MVSKIILGLGIFAVVFSVLIFSGKIQIGDKKNTPQGEVLLWGTFPEAGMSKIIQEFNPKARTYRVIYRYIREEEFSQKLVEALANGQGPDVIMAPYQILLAQSSRLYPMPLTTLGEKTFKDAYVDGASILFSKNGALALPVAVDPMVLFYNRTLFSKHGVINPPQYWDEVTSTVPSLTLLKSGKFVESGIALGAPNTPYAKDILMTIVRQLGQKPVIIQYGETGEAYPTVTVNDPVTEGGDVSPLSSSLRYFTQFADAGQNAYSWNQYSGGASDQFVAEKLAMYIGYAGELPTLRARNPRGEFEMSYLPQTRGYNSFETGMKLYGIATLKTSRNINGGLTVEGQFAGQDISPRIAALINTVPAFRGFAGVNGLHAVTARSMLVAKGWYDTRAEQSSEFVSSMISDVVSGRQGVEDAAATFVGRLRTLYTQY